MACGGQPEVTPPELVGVENPSTATIVCSGDTFTFKLDQDLTDNGGIFLVIEATEGQSNGVTRAHSAAAPKIFFRYYFVNSSTGEKSGTMLAECKWTAAAAAGGEP